MTNSLQIGEALARETLPLAKRRQLCGANVRPRGRLAVVLSLHQSCDECRASSLARCRWSEEDLLQNCIALILRILDVFRQARLLEMHDVLAAARSRADEDHVTNDRRSVLGHLLGEHTAKGETEDVAGRDTEAVEEGQDVPGHFGHRLGYIPGRAPDARVVKEDDLPSGGKRIGDSRIPVVESSGEVLQEEQWSRRAIAEPAICVPKAVHLEELRGRGRIT